MRGQCRTPGCPHLAVGIMFIETEPGSEVGEGVPMCLYCVQDLTTFLVLKEREGASVTKDMGSGPIING